MSIPSSSSNASSPSLNNPRSGDEGAVALLNPLFVNTSGMRHNIVHNHNHSNKSSMDASHSHTSNPQHSDNHSHNSSHNHSHNYISTNRVKDYPSINRTSNNNLNRSTGIILSGNSSPASMHFSDATHSRKVHVVYYLSRSGQLEHPHLLEVSIPPNQGLYLRDVKKRLAVIRGKRLPVTFAWSYKRSYKNGYVWQDLCDDDLIFPAHGCEYVLKGSEILSDQVDNGDECVHNNAETEPTPQHVSSKDQVPTSLVSKEAYHNHDQSTTLVSASVPVSMVEIGTDAATQTEEEMRRSDVDTHELEGNPNSLYISCHKLNDAKLLNLSPSPHKPSCTSTRPEHATELSRNDIASPPSSSSATNSPSPYKELASTSSSSASGFNMITECNDNTASTEHGNPSDCTLGIKTPGRSWMKRVTHQSDEQEEINCLHAAQEEDGINSVGLTNEAPKNANTKNKYRSMGSNSVGAVIMEEGERSPVGSAKLGRTKHSGALSLLQFMSCGGLDIKEQILPMSLYRLRSKGSPVTGNQLHMSNYVLSPEHLGAEALGYGSSETGKLWGKIGKPKSMYNMGSSKPPNKAGDEQNVVSDVDNQWVRNKYHHYQHEGASAIPAPSPSPPANGCSSKTLGAGIPDVISIGRSSVSDRSTNASHELQYHVAEAQAKLRKSGEVINTQNTVVIRGSPRYIPKLEVLTSDMRSTEGPRSNACMVSARAVSGEIVMSKGSPLFVPTRRHLSYCGTPINHASNGKKPPLAQLNASTLHAHDAGNNQISTNQDVDNKACSSRCNPSRAFSEGEVSSLLLASRMAHKSMTINSYDQSMAQLWEELLAAPTAATKAEEHQQQHQDAEYQRVRQATAGSVSGSSSWEVERTLQNAVELSLQPPLDHLPLLLDCPQCGRKVKADLLKAHAKNCSSPKQSTALKSSCLLTPATTSASASHSSSNGNSLGKSPKSDSNLCQRFLRASPPPTEL